VERERKLRYSHSMADTIFSKIIAGEIPCHRVYEDDKVLAFLDINPLSRGHTLVIPKEQAVTIDQLSDESAAAVGRVLPRLSRAVLRATGATAFNILQNNGVDAHQAVMHVHFHIIPRYADGAGLGIGWPARQLGADEGKQLAATIAGYVAET
jgi:histidine triad (HIT) family protein